MTIREYMKQYPLFLDGGTGTLLQAAGLKPGEATESWNITHADEIVKIHKAYFDAGSNVVATNTFGVHLLKYSEEQISALVKAAVAHAQKAKAESGASQEKFIALDVGPLGRLLKPFGDLDFEDAVRAFAPSIRAGAEAGVDLILIETMNDCCETKAAVLAAKENSRLPIFVSNAYSEDGRLMSGASPEGMVAMLEAMGVDAIGVNCSSGPDALAPIVEKYLELSSTPVICKPNAGLPHVVNGKTVFDVTPDDFARQMQKLAAKGASIIGGCCGTTPEYIRKTVERIHTTSIPKLPKKNDTVIASGTRVVSFAQLPILIGERINPTGKKRLKQALADQDMGYIMNEGLRQQECGAMVLDVNVGAPGIDEKRMLSCVAEELQAVCDLPLQLDSSDCAAMERAMRRYNGKALINSVNGKESSMKAVFPLVKKYGGVVVALTLDENGIPEKAADRVAIAEKILGRAKEYGIEPKDIVFDPLALTVSADRHAPSETLEALRTIRYHLGCHTLLGVSNVSFGLPCRSEINSVFFTMALENGLSAAIMNPFSTEMMGAYHAWQTLRGKNASCMQWIQYAERKENQSKTAEVNSIRMDNTASFSLMDSIKKGLKEQASAITKERLASVPPLELVQKEIIPALNEIGKDFEEKRAYLPQLLMSAEAAGYAFEEVKAALTLQDPNRTVSEKGNGCKVILATVKGDIHDIGKNIVRLLLENYGFEVYDLGKDVSPQSIAEETLKLKAPLVGLSALMTTTVPAMEETIALIRKKAAFAKVVVGGAVLTEAYAKAIGADHYAATAMDTVRYAQDVKEHLPHESKGDSVILAGTDK